MEHLDKPSLVPSPFGDWRFVARGASAELYDLGDGRILKIFRDTVSDDMIAREAAASLHAASLGLPTAPALDSYVHAGRRGIVYPYLEGESMMGWLRRHPLRAGWALDRMAALQLCMHRFSSPPLRTLKQVLETDIAYGPAPPPVQQAAIAYLKELPDEAALVHGDFHLGNVMMTPQGLMLIDWSKAAMGHPAADVVRSEMLMRFGVGPHDWITNLWRDWAAKRLRQSYLASSGLSLADLATWRPVVALAWLRARDAGRNPAFRRYLDRALADARLPALDAG